MHSKGNNSPNKKRKSHQMEVLGANSWPRMAGGSSRAAGWSGSTFSIQITYEA